MSDDQNINTGLNSQPEENTVVNQSITNEVSPFRDVIDNETGTRIPQVRIRYDQNGKFEGVYDYRYGSNGEPSIYTKEDIDSMRLSDDEKIILENQLGLSNNHQSDSVNDYGDKIENIPEEKSIVMSNLENTDSLNQSNVAQPYQEPQTLEGDWEEDAASVVEDASGNDVNLPEGITFIEDGIRIQLPEEGGVYKVDEIDSIPNNILNIQQKDQIRRHFFDKNKQVLGNPNPSNINTPTQNTVTNNFDARRLQEVKVVESDDIDTQATLDDTRPIKTVNIEDDSDISDPDTTQPIEIQEQQETEAIGVIEFVRRSLRTAYEQANERLQANQERLNNLNQEFQENLASRTQNNLVQRQGVRLMNAIGALGQNFNTPGPAIRGMLNRLRGPQITQQQQQQNANALTQAQAERQQKVNQRIQNVINNGGGNAADRGLLFRGARGILRGMFQTQRLINRVENARNDNEEYYGRYVARYINEHGESVTRETASWWLTRRYLDFKELTGFFTNTDFVYRDNMTVEDAVSLADIIANAGLTRGREVVANTNGQRNQIRAFGRDLFRLDGNGRLGRANPIRNGVALGLRLFATGYGVTGARDILYNLARLGTLTLAPAATMLDKRRDIIDQFGESGWARMRWPALITSALSGYFSYLGPLREWTENITNDLLVDRVGGVLADEAKRNVEEMAVSWGLRYSTNFIGGNLLNLIYAAVIGQHGSERGLQSEKGWKRTWALANSTAGLSAQSASFFGAAQFASNMGLFKAGENALLGRDIKIDTSPSIDEIYSQESDIPVELQQTQNEILRSMVAPGNEPVTLANGNIPYLNVDGVMVPLEHPNVPQGIFNEAANNQYDNAIGNAVSSVATQLSENAGIFDDVVNNIARNQIVVDIGQGEYVNVSQIQLDANTKVPWKGDNRRLFSVPVEEGSYNSMLYLGEHQIGYSLNNGELQVIHAPETDWYPEIYAQSIENPSAHYDVLEIQAYMTGERTEIPNPTFLIIENEDGSLYALRHIEDVSNIDDSIFEGRAAYVNPAIGEGTIYDASGNIMAVRELVRIPVNNEMFFDEQYLIKSPTDNSTYILPTADNLQITLQEIVNDSGTRYEPREVIFNGQRYFYNIGTENAGGEHFYYTGSDTSAPAAIKLVQGANGIEANYIYSIIPNENNTFELPFGVDPSDLSSLQEQAANIPPIENFITDSSGQVLGIGPLVNETREVYETNGHSPGSILSLAEDRIVIRSRFHDVATRNFQNQEVKFLVPSDGSVYSEDLVYSPSSPAITSLDPNSTHIAYLIGADSEIVAAIEFDNSGNLIKFNDQPIRFENGELNYNLVDLVHKEFGIDTNQPIIWDRTTLDITYSRIEDTTEFTPIPINAPEEVVVNPDTSGNTEVSALPQQNPSSVIDQPSVDQQAVTRGQVDLPGRIEGDEGIVDSSIQGQSVSILTPQVVTTTQVDANQLEQLLSQTDSYWAENTGTLHIATYAYNELLSVNSEQEFNQFLQEYGITLSEGRNAEFYLNSTENKWKLSFDVADAVATADTDRVRDIRGSNNQEGLTTSIMQTWKQGVQNGSNNIVADNLTPYETPLKIAIENTEIASQTVQLPTNNQSLGGSTDGNTTAENLMRTLSINGVEYNATITPTGEIIVTYLDPVTGEVKTIQGNNEVTFQLPLNLRQRVNEDPGFLELIGNGIGDVLETGQSVLEKVFDIGGDAANVLDRALNQEIGSGDDNVGLIENFVNEDLGENRRAGQEIRSVINPITNFINENIAGLALFGVAVIGFNNDRYVGRTIRLFPNYALGATRFLDRAAAKSPRSPVGIAGRILIPQSKRAELDVIRMERNLKKLQRKLDEIELKKINRGYASPITDLPGTPAGDFKVKQQDKVTKIMNRMNKYNTRYGLDSRKVKRSGIKSNLNKRRADVLTTNGTLAPRIANI